MYTLRVSNAAYRELKLMLEAIGAQSCVTRDGLRVDATVTTRSSLCTECGTTLVECGSCGAVRCMHCQNGFECDSCGARLC